MRFRKSRRAGSSGRSFGPRPPSSSTVPLLRGEALHGDRPGGTARRAQTAADADLLVLEDDGSFAPALHHDGGDLLRPGGQLAHQGGGDDFDAILGADVL